MNNYNIKGSDMKRLLVILMLIFLMYGCNKPYALLDERKKIMRTFQQYITLLQEGKYNDSYELLYLGHIPDGGNRKMYVAAQRLMDKICTAINYEANVPIVKGDIAIMDLDMIFNYKNGNSIKKKTQVFFVKSDKKWKIAIGDYRSRLRILRIYPQFKSLPLKPDKAFILKNGGWKEIKEPKSNEKGQTILKDSVRNMGNK